MISHRNDPLSIDTLRMRISMMSNETLREIAKQPRGFDGVLARKELARRDDEVTFAE